MSYKVDPLALPDPIDPTQSRFWAQLRPWTQKVTRALNALSGEDGYAASGNAGSIFSTITFTGSDATIDINGSLAQFVTGGTSIQNINPPQNFCGMFFLIPTNSFTLVSGGNIQIPAGGISCIANQMVIMVFDGSNWYAGRVS